MKEKKIPIVIGEELVITPTGWSKKDPFYNLNGFIIFIKEVPDNDALTRMRIRITAIKTSFAFAQYVDDA